METGQETEVTRLLQAVSAGDAAANDRLMPLVYDELRRMAGAMMARERGPGPYTLQPTALVHEAYLKLVGPKPVAWDSKAHFFGAAAQAMRRILIDRARHVKSGRGKPIAVADMSQAAGNETTVGSFAAAADELLDLDRALTKLRGMDARQHEVVMLRYFAGLTIEQTACALGVSSGTVKNDWTFARAWLLREMAAHRTEER